MFRPEQKQGQGLRKECSLERDQENLKMERPCLELPGSSLSPSLSLLRVTTVLSAELSPDFSLSCPVCLQPVSEGYGGGLPCSFSSWIGPLFLFCPSHGCSSSKCKKLQTALLPVSGSGGLMTAKPLA